MDPEERGPENWRRIARRDWQGLHILLSAGDGAGAGFFLQQTIEKFLKGYLIARGWQLRRTHELDRLLDAACGHDPTLAAFRPFCERVSGYYVIERYPGTMLGGPDVQQVGLDLDEARRLVSTLFPDEQL